MEDFIPWRVCCGRQHFGVECPDGKVMCCICFERVTKNQLAMEEDGILVDVCIPCREWEIERLNASNY